MKTLRRVIEMEPQAEQTPVVEASPLEDPPAEILKAVAQAEEARASQERARRSPTKSLVELIQETFPNHNIDSVEGFRRMLGSLPFNGDRSANPDLLGGRIVAGVGVSGIGDGHGTGVYGVGGPVDPVFGPSPIVSQPLFDLQRSQQLLQGAMIDPSTIYSSSSHGGW